MLFSMKSIHRHGYLGESAYQKHAGLSLQAINVESRDLTFLCTVQMRADKELIVSYAFIACSPV